MKRVGLIVGAILTAGLIVAAGVELGPQRLTVAIQTASAAPAPPPPKDPLANNSGPVCVAVPVFTNQAKGNCKGNTVEIPANQPGGPIVFYLKLVLKLINGLVAGIILLMLVIAGIQYITSAGDPTRVKGAKSRVIHAVTALVLYLMMFAILNFLVPGGILT